MLGALKRFWSALGRRARGLVLKTKLSTARARMIVDKSSGARDVAGSLRRSVSSVRLYGIDHHESQEAIAALYALLRVHLYTTGDIKYEVEPHTLMFNGNVLLREHDDDSMIAKLFNEGIASITFHTVLKEDALRKYLELWNDSLKAPNDPERSFAARAWEADLPGITTRLRAAFGEFQGSDADELRRHYTRLLEAIRNVAPPPPRAEQQKGPSSAEQIEGGLVASTAPPPPAEISEHELNLMFTQVANSNRGAGQRILLRLWSTFGTLEADDQAELLHLAAAVIDGLAAVGRSKEIARAFVRIVASARGDSGAEASLDRFLYALGNERVVATLVGQVSRPDSDRDALWLLRELPSHFAEHLLKSMSTAPVHAQDKLTEVLQAKVVAPERMAVWMIAYGDTLGERLLHVAEKMTPFHLDAVLRMSLLHDSVALRRRAIAKIDRASADRYRSLLELNAEHEDLAVRTAALELLLPLADPHALELFTRQLKAPDGTVTTQKIAVKALASIGGTSAVRSLADAFVEQKDREVKLILAHVLANVPEERAEQVLRQETKRWFADAELKTICKSALKRRQRQLAAGGNT
jgi:hypothetical protein